MIDQKATISEISAEVTVSTNGSGGSTPMSPTEFIEYLQANGFVGNTAVNNNYPGVAWIGFKNNIK